MQLESGKRAADQSGKSGVLALLHGRIRAQRAADHAPLSPAASRWLLRLGCQP
jgi:hypothetical protein